MGHPQGKTPTQTDNSTAHGVINGKIQPKQTKVGGCTPQMGIFK
jgi:hypothetical protein